MLKEIQKTKQKEGLKLYLQGMNKDRIAKQIGVSDKTIDRWEKKHNWKVLYQKMDNQVSENLMIDIVAEKTRSLKLIRAIESIYAKQLQKGIFIKTSEFAQVQKAKWEILMPRTISQYNFMKQENTVNEPTYTLNIIPPNDNSNEMETKSETNDSIPSTQGQENN